MKAKSKIIKDGKILNTMEYISPIIHISNMAKGNLENKISDNIDTIYSFDVNLANMFKQNLVSIPSKIGSGLSDYLELLKETEGYLELLKSTANDV